MSAYWEGNPDPGMTMGGKPIPYRNSYSNRWFRVFGLAHDVTEDTIRTFVGSTYGIAEVLTNQHGVCAGFFALVALTDANDIDAVREHLLAAHGLRTEYNDFNAK
jgi:hypothetical protein